MEQRNASILSNSSRSFQRTEPPSSPTKKSGGVTQMPCNSTGCLRFGTPEKDGLCEECYLKKRNARPTATSATQANKPQRVGNSNSLYATHHTEQNRQFVNSTHPASYSLQGPVQVSQTQSPPYGSGGRRHDFNSGSIEGSVQGLKCRGTNCHLFGTPEMNGYCSRCFMESTIPQSGPCSVPGNELKC